MFSDQIIAYAKQFSELESDLLRELNRAAHLRLLQPRMLSGHMQGLLLSLICKILSPINVLELGAYSGYSTIVLAEALEHPQARLHSIECNEELADFIEPFVQKSQAAERVILHYASALEILPSLLQEYPFQLVYIDADKREYPDYYRMIVPYLSKGAVIIADNTLWSGKVVMSSEREKDAQCAAIHRFNQLVAEDDSVEQIILPIRDGLTLIRKK